MTRSVKSTITPEQAADWLMNEPATVGVRIKNPQSIERYAAVMKAGQWAARRGDFIDIEADGRIADGFHRLSACVISQASFATYLQAPRAARQRRKKLGSTSERLSAAHVAAKTIAKQIAVFEQSRRLALLIDDDESAERADRQLMVLRGAAQRAADKIKLLEPIAEAESQDEHWPQDVKSAQTRLDQMRTRHDALARKRVMDRSAGDQSELDGLVCGIPAMANHIALLERMAA
jgi:hypothetical protein